MLGIPTETKEEALDTFRMIKTIAPEALSPVFFTPVPGSYMFDYCRTHGLMLSEDLTCLDAVIQISQKSKEWTITG
jgi:radical SAM superfamily enzyme YgiQ (UPF0313 family)